MNTGPVLIYQTLLPGVLRIAHLKNNHKSLYNSSKAICANFFLAILFSSVGLHIKIYQYINSHEQERAPEQIFLPGLNNVTIFQKV